MYFQTSDPKSDPEDKIIKKSARYYEKGPHIWISTGRERNIFSVMCL